MRRRRLAWIASLPAVAVLGSPAAVLAGQQPQRPGPDGHLEHQAGETPGGLFPPREASGTAWQPDEPAAHLALRRWRGWEVMLHGAAFVHVLYEPGEIHRTGGYSRRQAGSINWGMARARRLFGAGRIGMRAMGSLEPWTLPGCGYISLLATGEVCKGDTIHDRQHPHDLVMELAAEYDRPLRGALRWQIYGGAAGEPALGPAGFPHRASAGSNPLAPIGHHWLDSSHITFGLVTAGLYDRRWKAEASLFNAREPDEHRLDLDLGPLDSVSARISVLPTARLALQVSAGRLREVEAAFPPQPRGDVTRVTSSAAYHRALAGNQLWVTTLAFGLNAGREVIPGGSFHAVTRAALLESQLSIAGRHAWFGRAEVVEKPAHDLHAHEYATSIFAVGRVQAGYVRDWRAWKGLAAGIGATLSANLVPPELAPRYNGRVALGFGVFLMVRPAHHAGP